MLPLPHMYVALAEHDAAFVAKLVGATACCEHGARPRLLSRELERRIHIYIYIHIYTHITLYS